MFSRSQFSNRSARENRGLLSPFSSPDESTLQDEDLLFTHVPFNTLGYERWKTIPTMVDLKFLP